MAQIKTTIGTVDWFFTSDSQRERETVIVERGTLNVKQTMKPDSHWDGFIRFTRVSFKITTNNFLTTVFHIVFWFTDQYTSCFTVFARASLP